MSIAEIIAIAARMNNIYNGSEAEFTDNTENGGEWYDSYVDYAEENDIVSMDEILEMGDNASRSLVISLIARCLPKEAFAPINSFTEIPDVDPNDPNAAAIYMLYNAGILVGTDALGTFAGDRPITRAEVAILLGRCVDASQRIKVEAPAAEESAE